MIRQPESRWPPVTYWMKVTAAVLLVIAVARMVLVVGPVLVLVLVSLVLALGFQPALAWFERRGLSRALSVTLGLLGGLVVMGLFFWIVLPDVISELTALGDKIPDYIGQAESGSGFLGDLNEQFDLSDKVADLQKELPGTVLGLVGSLGSFIFGSLTVLILTLYFTINLPKMERGVARLLGRRDREEFHEIYEMAIRRVGGYVLGNLTISAIAGVLSFIALTIIGVPFAAALAFFVALMDLIPTIGALIGAAVATLVAAFAGVPELIATAAFFLVYQQIENYVVQPRVMGKALEMSAPIIILAVMIGGTLLGVIGALLAIPVAAVIKVAIEELYLEDRRDRIRTEELGTVPE